MKQATILVVEDDAAIRQGIVDALEYNGYAVHEAGDGLSGAQLATSVDCELLLLDLVLPGCEGLEILHRVRADRPTLPVIILTARGSESDRVKGLKLGADDYVVKPFSVAELLARVEAVLRRSPERPSDVRVLVIDGGIIDFDRCEVRLDDSRRIELSPRELELIRYLAGNAGRAISREEILRRVWGIDSRNVETRTIDMHVARLREKLGDDPGRPRILLTVRGKGYMFAAGKGDA